MIFLLTPLFLLLVGLFFWRSTQTKRIEHKQENETYSVDSIVPILYKDSGLVQYEGIIKPLGIKNVSFAISGTLLQGDFALEVGKTFQENDILFKQDIYKLYKEISVKKKALKVLAERLNQEIAIDYGSQSDFWDSFTSTLLPTKRLPAFPPFIKESKNKKMQEFTEAYKEVEKLEESIEAYYFFAPFSGTVLSINKKIGDQIHVGECVAQIAPFQSYFAEFKVPKEEIDLLKLKDEVSLSLNKKQVKGRVIKISRSKDSAYATIECSLSTTVLTRGEKITIQRLRKSEYLYIPCHLLRNDSLWISRQGRSLKIHATIMDWKKDSVAIKELKPGDLVLRKRPKSVVIACP
jgi:biotin carboxyl carrier protein